MLRFATGVAIILHLAGCGASPTDDFKDVYRAIESQDGSTTASLARVARGGAAGSLAYKVYLSKKASDDSPELVFDGYSDCNADIEWRENSLLVIRYAGGLCDVRLFHNFWYERELARVHAELPRVEIALERVPPSTTDPWRPQ